MDTTNRPQVTADTIGQYSLAFERDHCGRCGGSGTYSYNQMHGDTCYGCSGAGKCLTRAGSNARERMTEVRDQLMGTVIETIQPGDIIHGCPIHRFRMLANLREGWYEVKQVESHEPRPDGAVQIDLLVKPATKDQPSGDWKTGDLLGVVLGFAGSTRIPCRDTDAVVTVWNETLKLPGAYLVHQETGEKIGARDMEKRAARKAEQAEAGAQELTAEHPHLADLLDAELDSSRSKREEILASLQGQLRDRGRLSEKQIDLAARLLEEHAQAAESTATARYAADIGSEVTVTGVVRVAKEGENRRGPYVLLVVEGTGDDTGGRPGGC